MNKWVDKDQERDRKKTEEGNDTKALAILLDSVLEQELTDKESEIKEMRDYLVEKDYDPHEHKRLAYTPDHKYQEELRDFSTYTMTLYKGNIEDIEDVSFSLDLEIKVTYKGEVSKFVKRDMLRVQYYAYLAPSIYDHAESVGALPTETLSIALDAYHDLITEYEDIPNSE